MTRADKLQAEAGKLNARLTQVRKELHLLDKDDRRKRLEKNVGKCFVQPMGGRGVCNRYYLVIGVDKGGDRNTVISIIISGGWIQFEVGDFPGEIEYVKRIARRRFDKQLKKLQPYLIWEGI